MNMNHNERRRNPIWCAALLASLLPACSGQTGADIGKEEAPIFNGTEVSETNSGVVKLETEESFCSGTLLTNQWVLTAAHCVNLNRDRTFLNAFSGFYYGNRFHTIILASKFDSSGRLVIAGRSYGNNDSVFHFYLARFTANGDVDRTFGGTGEVVTDFPLSSAEGIQDIEFDGSRIVAVGWATPNGQTTHQLAVARYTDTGAPDFAFGIAGQSQVDLPNSSTEDANAVVIDSKSGIIVTGPSKSGNVTRMFLARINPTGQLDTRSPNPDFVAGGVTITNINNFNDVPLDMIYDGSGRIIVTGVSNNHLAVARYSNLGALDGNFGNSGIALATDPPTSTGFTLLKQGTNVLVGGQRGSQPTVWRLTNGTTDAGQFDPNFGTFSVATLDHFRIVPGGRVIGLGLAADGRIRVGMDGAVDSGGGRIVRAYSYAELGSNGGLRTDRIFPENHGTVIPSVFKTMDSATAFSMAISGSRVVIAGTVALWSSNPMTHLAVLTPDLLQSTAFTGHMYANMGDQTNLDVDRAYEPAANVDAAIVHLATPMRMNNATTGYRFPGFATSSTALVGTNVTCVGYGNNALSAAGDPTGFGVLRSGTSRVTGTDANYALLGFTPTGTPQLPMPGDSGSSCRTSTNLLVGVQSRGSVTSSTNGSGWAVRPELFSAWANQLILQP